MPLLHSIKRLIHDPPPACVFEFSEAGIAYCWTEAGTSGFEPLPPEALKPSPLEDNFRQPAAIAAALARIAPPDAQKKRRGAALLLPDYAVRLTVLDFDSFPGDAEEQESLVRFRLKKSVPFDLDEAAVRYHAMPDGKRTNVLAATVSSEVLVRYEVAIRHAGFQPGLVTTSSLAALELVDGQGIQVFLKLTGLVLTVMAIENGVVRLVRCVETDEGDSEEILSILFPTLAYVSDEMSGPAQKIVHCGFGPEPAWSAHVHLPLDPLRSAKGLAGPHYAGLAGLIERMAA